MDYFEEVLDRSSGDLVTVPMGDWITISELGAQHGVGRREVRTVLTKMGVLNLEGNATKRRNRLAQWVVDKKWGKRIERANSYPFDVLGPDIQHWINARWEQTRAQIANDASEPTKVAKADLERFNATRLNRELSVEEAVSWLADHFRSLSQQEMAAVLDVSQQIVSRFLNIRSGQRKAKAALLNADPDTVMAYRSKLWRHEGVPIERSRLDL